MYTSSCFIAFVQVASLQARLLLMFQALELSQFLLLQCATSEAVLRLDKTQLSSEAKDIQDLYLDKQRHETLLQYLERFVVHETKKHRPLFIQVTEIYVLS